MYGQLMDIIGNLGFPIALSIYLLARFEMKIDILSKSFHEFEKDIAAVIKSHGKNR